MPAGGYHRSGGRSALTWRLFRSPCSGDRPPLRAPVGGRMDRIAAVGASVVIKGELSASEDVVIAGRVEGTSAVEGHLVVVEPGGQVAADVVAKGVVIAGTVQGSVVAEERIELRSTARVEGELRRPASIAEWRPLRRSRRLALSGEVETSKPAKARLRSRTGASSRSEKPRISFPGLSDSRSHSFRTTDPGPRQRSDTIALESRPWRHNQRSGCEDRCPEFPTR